MKLNHQLQYFINGIILLFLGLFSVTHLPFVLTFNWQNYIYFQIEFFAFSACAIFFLFSPKYYKSQIFVILIGLLYYILFVRFH